VVVVHLLFDGGSRAAQPVDARAAHQVVGVVVFEVGLVGGSSLRIEVVIADVLQDAAVGVVVVIRVKPIAFSQDAGFAAAHFAFVDIRDGSQV